MPSSLNKHALRLTIFLCCAVSFVLVCISVTCLLTGSVVLGRGANKSGQLCTYTVFACSGPEGVPLRVSNTVFCCLWHCTNVYQRLNIYSLHGTCVLVDRNVNFLAETSTVRLKNKAWERGLKQIALCSRRWTTKTRVFMSRIRNQTVFGFQSRAEAAGVCLEARTYVSLVIAL